MHEKCTISDFYIFQGNATKHLRYGG